MADGGRVRKAVLGAGCALVLSVASVAWAPPASAATPADDVGMMVSGDYAEFDVLANDVPSGGDQVVLDDTSNPAVSAFDTTISVDQSGQPAYTGELTIGYHVVDVDGNPAGSATLKVQVVPRNLQVEAGNGSATVTWPGLTPGTTGLRISYSEQYVDSHAPNPAVTTANFPGTGPQAIDGLHNGTSYWFYVTPYVTGGGQTSELAYGESRNAMPRATNAAPVAVPDTVSLLDGQIRYFSPLDNDTDQDFDELSMVSHTAPAHGVLNCDYGYCDYTPTGAPQADSFGYTISDGHGGQASTTVTFVARHVVAADDSATTPAEETTVVNVLANDTGVLADDVVDVGSAAGVQAFTNEDRTVSLSSTTPGSYSVPYTVYTSDYEVLATATISLTVGPRRELVVNDDSWSTEMNLPTKIRVYSNDRINLHTGFPLSDDSGITVQAQHGVATLDFEPRRFGVEYLLRNVPVVHYVPNPNFHGTDTLTYRLVDKQGRADDAVVTVDVGTPNPYYLDATEGIGTATLEWASPESPAVDDFKLCYTVGTTRDIEPALPTMPCAHEVPLPAGTPTSAQMSGLANDVWYAAAVFAHYNDGSPAGVWSEGTHTWFRPGVRPVRDLWSEAGADQATLTWINPAGATGSTGTTIGWSTGPAPEQPGTGTGWTSVGPGVTTATLTGLTAGQTYHVSVFATATNTWADPEQRTFTVNPGNVQPTVVNDSLTVDTGGYGSLDVLANDTDNEPLTVRSWTDGAHGSVYCNPSGGCYYDANSASYLGPDSFTYTVSDGRFGIRTGTVSVTIAALPDAPQADNGTYTATQGQARTISLDDLTYDPDGEALTYSVVTPPSGGGLTCAANGQCSYTGPAVGNFTFTYRATDPTSRADDGVVTLHVVANQPPVPGEYFVTVAPGATRVVDVAADTTDVDGGPLTYTLESQAQKGTATCTAVGSCSYVARAGRLGDDSFTYTVDDGRGGVAIGSVEVHLQAVNHAPVATNHTYATDNGNPLAVNLASITSDADGDPLTFAKVGGPAAASGTVTCQPSGQCTYQPAATFTGTATFTYKANDGQVDSNTATVTLNVSQVNRPPVADDETTTIRTGDTAHVNVAQGDTDADGDPLTFAKATDPTHGTATCTSAGVCDYTSAAGYLGSDSFTYTVTDGRGGSDTGTVSVTVVANRAPVADDETATTHPETPVDVDVSIGDSDPDGDTLTYARATDPAHGTATCTAAGLCTYTPGTGFTGPDSFTYEVTDGHGGTATATVSITVEATGTVTIVRGGPATRSVKTRLAVTGTISPARAGSTVQLQRLGGATWGTIATTTETAAASYSFSVVQPTGSWQYRVVLPAASGRSAATSAVISAGFYALSMPSHKASGDEFVTVKNTGKVAVNLARWTITTKARKVLVLPSRKLAAGASVRVHPGTGKTTAKDLYLRKGASFATHDSLKLRDLAKMIVASRTW